MKSLRLLALAAIVALGVVASVPREAFANCGPNNPWPNCKRSVPGPHAPKAAEPSGTQGAVPDALELVRLLLFALLT
jgi:hypothetical protein